MNKRMLALMLAMSLAPTGCGNHEEEDAFADACSHIGDAGEAVTAAVESSVDAPAVGGDAHTAYGITLGALDAGYEGYVTFASDEAAEFALVLSADMDVEITDAEGNAVGIEETQSDVCADTAGVVAHIADFEVGTYIIKLSSADSDGVTLLIAEYGAEHAHEEH